QVIQKMKARVESGYWVFRVPVGYKYVSGKGHGGKVLVPDEPLATVVREALEGFACGRFASQAEVQRFLEGDPYFPKDRKDGSLRPMTVSRLLRKVVYAGYVEAPAWGVPVREGQHEGLIDFRTHQRILDNLDGRKRPAARKDFNEDFPLRGYVYCADCGHAMTAAWSKGMTRHYAYYLCDTRGCVSKRKSIPRAKIEDGFAEILQALQPTKGLFDVAKAMLRDAWAMRLEAAQSAKEEWQRQLSEVGKQIDGLLDRIVDATNPTVIGAYEKRIEKLERERFVLAERVVQSVPPKGRLEEVIELSLKFLSSPWNIYKNGSHAMRQTVLRLAFSEPLKYQRNEGYRTPELSFPFRALGGFSGRKSEMVL
ncbi:MAG: zinc ribbon domain-containing protein, partial [Paracoccus sp. (in: a-proteobacteria)]|uniref:recombinase zinc beta ribbon domain-containing protein n=1 Tax=Paracoccus sp. TaxID=267 RepID=UPI0039E2CED0